MKKGEKLVGIILAGFLALIAAFSIGDFLDRGLWYDEALTILEFVAWPESYLGVYLNYAIPNNHILYSVFMRFWLGNAAPFLGFSNLVFRLPSFIAGLFLLAASFFLWSKRASRSSAFIVLGSLAVSPVFALYSTAARGYIFSMLAVSLAIPAALAACENRKFAFHLYCVISFVAVGIMPSNVVAIFAASLLPFILGKLRPGGRAFLRFCSAPFVALFLFYFPIFGKFIKALSVEEGWRSPFAAALVFYAAASIVFLVPVLISCASLFFESGGKKRSFLLCACVFLIPAFFFFLRSPSPFPRTFLCVLPVWLFLFAVGIQKFESRIIALRSANFARWAMSALALLCLVFGRAAYLGKDHFSEIVSRFGQDDFFSPYFMSEDFRPDDSAARLMKLAERRNGIIFVEPSADPPSLVFSAKRLKMSDDFIVFDRPAEKVESFPASPRENKAFIVARDNVSAAEIGSRFRLKITGEEQGNLRQRIFRAEKEDR